MNKNQVLRQRVRTAIVFGAVVISLLTSGAWGESLLFLLIAIGVSYEYSRMIHPTSVAKQALSILMVLATIASIYFFVPNTTAVHYGVLMSCLGLLLGIANMYKNFINHKRYYWLVSILYFGLPIGFFIDYLINHRHHVQYLTLFLIILIWASDSFAYLVGSRIGKRKLMERISPKKTWEGFFGGGIFAIGAAVVIGYYNEELPMDFWIIAALIAWIIGTMGDLVESSVKRSFDIKDSGRLLPGHGGLLDRFDSLIYILPFILFLLEFFK